MTPDSFCSIRARARMPGATTASVVTSPGPTSSASARSIRSWVAWDSTSGSYWRRYPSPVSEPRSKARLPRAVRPPFRVFVNGVEQREGVDYSVEGDHLLFTRSLAQEGRLGFWRWTSMFLGIAGTYRKHDT